MKRSFLTIFTVGCVLVFGAFLAVGAVAADSEQEVEKKVKVHKIKMDCDGEDCKAGEHRIRKIFVNEDGEVTELTGDDANVWVDSEDGHVMIRHMGEGMHAMHGKAGFLGVGLSELTPELREHFGATAKAGVMVANVMDDSPAARAGVQVGDVITAVDGKDVESGGSLGGMIRKHGAGDTVVLSVVRAGKAETLSAALEEREAPAMKKMMGMKSMMGDHKIHMMHGGDGEARQIRVRCEREGEDEKDCTVDISEGGDLGDFDCGSDNCEVKVVCKDDGCDCTVNGAASDCDEIPGFAESHGG